MSNREFKQTDTSTNAKMDSKPPEPALPIPWRVIRWVLYSFVFMLLLVPFVAGSQHDGPKAVCGGIILGWFASQLNALINKK